MPLLNYTSDVDADKTAMEIAKCLSMHGAQAVLTEYDPKDNIVSAISFRIKIEDQTISFRLPCDWKPVYAVIFKGKKTPEEMFIQKSRQEALHSSRREQAVKTAWRIVKDWVEAQMALVETNMAKTQEVFLPYAVMKDGKTLAEHVQSNPGFLLGNGQK